MQIRRDNLIAVVLCGALLALFTILSWSAIRQKSATADEPLHALAGYMRTFHGDYRLNPDHPPLWGYWAMIPHRSDTLKVDLESPVWKRLPGYIWDGTKFAVQTLYRTPGNDPDTFIDRSRAMMLVPAVLLGVMTIAWAWQLGGRLAGIIAGVLFCFDPNFLAHAPIVKDDVSLAAAALALAWVVWHAGQKLTILRVVGVGLLLAIALNLKYSGVLLVPIVAALLGIRAVLAKSWNVLNREHTVKSHKWITAASAVLVAGSIAWIGTWACHRFRYLPSPDPSISLDMKLIGQAATWSDLAASQSSRRPLTQGDLERTPPPMFVRLVLWMDDCRLMPQAWLAGMLETYKTTRVWPCFLMGQYSHTGWVSYYPLTFLFKTPLATLAAMATAILLLISPQRFGLLKRRLDRWTLSCLVLPAGAFALAAITSRLDQGVRHILTVYPFIYVLVPVSLARLWDRTSMKVLLIILTALLLFESLRAYPNYLAFFNTACEGSRGGIRLLGDSNLDWGQDLPLLVRWREQNPHERLYVSYFGMTDPDYYINNYTALPGNSGSSLQLPQLPREPGVLAVSASNLQGIYLDSPNRAMYQLLFQKHQPIEVLGGTIYLYRFDEQVARDMAINFDE